jgi:hypothetical protein
VTAPLNEAVDDPHLERVVEAVPDVPVTEFVAAQARHDAASVRCRHPLTPGTRSHALAGLCPSTSPLARGHGVVLGHRAVQPGLDEDLGHLAGSGDLLGEIVVGAEVVVVEEADRERATPLRVDALDDNREPRRSPPRAADGGAVAPAAPSRSASAVACGAAGQRYWPGR